MQGYYLQEVARRTKVLGVGAFSLLFSLSLSLFLCVLSFFLSFFFTACFPALVYASARAHCHCIGLCTVGGLDTRSF